MGPMPHEGQCLNAVTTSQQSFWGSVSSLFKLFFSLIFWSNSEMRFVVSAVPGTYVECVGNTKEGKGGRKEGRGEGRGQEESQI